ncbi:MAG: hypothetical protein AB4060_18235 [Crocosphaera sp.]
MNNKYSLGFISRSNLPKEMRSPIWYQHLTSKHLNHDSVKEFIFEENFGLHTFEKSADDHLLKLGCKVVDRFTLLKSSDIVISLKPTDEWQYMRPGTVLIGWFNHLQLPPKHTTNVKFLDLEDIIIWCEGRPQKLLYKNAHISGECGVLQTLETLQQSDPFSPAITEKKIAVVLGYGNLGIGATKELIRQGIEKIVVYTQRQPSSLINKLEGVEYRQMEYDYNNTYEVINEDLKLPLIDNLLPQADIIVNATIPSSSQPKWTFVPDDKFSQLKCNMAFIDPIHKPDHGANFTQTTELSQPLKLIKQSGHSIWYNGCNAMPNYRYSWASSIISEALLNNLDSIFGKISASKLPLLNRV